MLSGLLWILERVLWLLLFLVILVGDMPMPLTPPERVRTYTQGLSFNFTTWTINATWVKTQQAALGMPHYLDNSAQKEIVAEYFQVTQNILQQEAQLAQVYADPLVTEPESVSRPIRETLGALTTRQLDLAPMAESILQEQISMVLVELGLGYGGQIIPPVQYHVSPLPYHLIVSPRSRIEQIASIPINPNLTVDKQWHLENQVDQDLDVSSLVVPVGGIGTYPAMVMRSTNFPWVVETIAHEWVHNFLTLRPLGMKYSASPELRTMNETAASLAGKELRDLVLAKFYPQFASNQPYSTSNVRFDGKKPDPADIVRPVFDFRVEMNKTRVTVDQLLEEGQISQAELYMEERRELFWLRGYGIRKLNQAYFAFYGAYADVPGGAAGEDPVGPAVRLLRERSASLAEFLHTIAWIDSFSELEYRLQPAAP